MFFILYEYSLPVLYYFVPLVWAALYLRHEVYGKPAGCLRWLLPTAIIITLAYCVAGYLRACVFSDFNPSADAYFAKHQAIKSMVRDCLIGAVEIYVGRLLCQFLGKSQPETFGPTER